MKRFVFRPLRGLHAHPAKPSFKPLAKPLAPALAPAFAPALATLAVALTLAACASAPSGHKAGAEAAAISTAAPATPSTTPATGQAETAQASTVLHESEHLAHYRLANGLELIVKPDRRAPTAVHMLWVRAGSIDEGDGTSGIAHMLEHMMFKGSAALAPGEFSRRVAALGGQDNAFTNHDYTGYFQQVPANALEAVMALEAERFAHNQWPDEELTREMEVVKEERRLRTDDQPRARLYEQLMASAYIASPERRPVIGWMSDIEQYTPADVRHFYQRWYKPGNAAVVIVGQVQPREALRLAERHYGTIAPGALPARKITAEPAQHGPRRIVLRERAEQAVLLMLYKTPPLKHLEPAQLTEGDRDALALIALSGVLEGYKGARLERALTRGPARVADGVEASAHIRGRSGNGLFLLSAIPAPGVPVAKVEAALRQGVREVAQRGITQAELDRVITQWAAATVYAKDSMMAQALELGENWIEGWPLEATERLLALLRQVTPAQVQSVAQRYFGDTQLTIAQLQPQAQAQATAQKTAAKAAKQASPATRAH